MPLDPLSRRSRPGAVGQESETCPGCGGVLAALRNPRSGHPGASPSCARLFEVTLRGLREEAQADPTVAPPTVRLADAAYDAQHPVPCDPAALAAALERLAVGLTAPLAGPPAGRPRVWRTTIADVAADLDVIDLPALVRSWARAVHADWAARDSARA